MCSFEIFDNSAWKTKQIIEKLLLVLLVLFYFSSTEKWVLFTFT